MSFIVVWYISVIVTCATVPPPHPTHPFPRAWGESRYFTSSHRAPIIDYRHAVNDQCHTLLATIDLSEYVQISGNHLGGLNTVRLGEGGWGVGAYNPERGVKAIKGFQISNTTGRTKRNSKHAIWSEVDNTNNLGRVILQRAYTHCLLLLLLMVVHVGQTLILTLIKKCVANRKHGVYSGIPTWDIIK